MRAHELTFSFTSHSLFCALPDLAPAPAPNLQPRCQRLSPDTHIPTLSLVGQSLSSVSQGHSALLTLAPFLILIFPGLRDEPMLFLQQREIRWGWEQAELGLLLTSFGTINKSFHDYAPQSPYLENGNKTCLPSSSYKDIAKILTLSLGLPSKVRKYITNMELFSL